LNELDDLIKVESQALDRLHGAPSRSIFEQLNAYEDRIDSLMAEIFAIGRYSRKSN
jgi:hypothetical protein